MQRPFYRSLSIYKTHSHTNPSPHNNNNAENPNMSPLPLLCFGLLLTSFHLYTEAKISSKIGINYGQLGDNLPTPTQSIQLIKSLKASRVKLYNADPQVLKLLSNSNLEVSIMIPNQEIIRISLNQTHSDQWVRNNILPFYPQTKIRFLLVGNEVLSYHTDQDKLTWINLVPAMNRIKRSLKTLTVRKIKVGTPLAMDMLETSFPPSNGTFRDDITETVMRPLLGFLNRTKSFFFVDVYPYFPWASNPSSIHLDYALLKQTNVTYTDPNSHLTYTNLLDQMLDSVTFAMRKLGFSNINLVISETGWPNSGDVDEVGANIYNAATYNRNLVRKITSRPPVGTPARPGVVIPTFIFSLFNENLKTGPGTERNWGLLRPNGSRVYEVDLTGDLMESEYGPLPTASNDSPYHGNIWCVVAQGDKVNETVLGEAIGYACAQGNYTCTAIQPGNKCYEPVSLIAHANYAFSSYWNQFRSSGATCHFNGLAVQSTNDPSHGACKYPSVTV